MRQILKIYKFLILHLLYFIIFFKYKVTVNNNFLNQGPDQKIKNYAMTYNHQNIRFGKHHLDQGTNFGWTIG